MFRLFRGLSHIVSGGGNSVSFHRFLVIELQIAFISADVDLTPVDRLLHGAAGLVSVRAVGEPAVGDVRAKLDEVPLELAGNHAPELELAEARAYRRRGRPARGESVPRPTWCVFL